MDRRTFLKTLAMTAAVAAVKPSELLAREGRTSEPQAQGADIPDLVAVMGGEPDEMLLRALAELGGIERYVKPGYKVTIKPNIGWDRTPERAGNTNPLLVGTLVAECFRAGASEVTVFDHTCDNWTKCYQSSGIEDAVKAKGGKMLPANTDNYYREVELPQGQKLHSAKIHEAILDCDVWINVPILKHHGGSNLSAAMKNLMGIVWDRRAFHMNGLNQCIADICTLDKKPVLNIVDAYRTLHSNGPQGRSEEDVKLTKALFAGPDFVTVDTAACRFFSQLRDTPVDTVGYLADGEALQLGTTHLDQVNVKRIKL